MEDFGFFKGRVLSFVIKMFDYGYIKIMLSEIIVEN